LWGKSINFSVVTPFSNVLKLVTLFLRYLQEVVMHSLCEKYDSRLLITCSCCDSQFYWPLRKLFNLFNEWEVFVCLFSYANVIWCVHVNPRYNISMLYWWYHHIFLNHFCPVLCIDEGALKMLMRHVILSLVRNTKCSGMLFKSWQNQAVLYLYLVQ
jgi:hypothetical protein